MEQPARRNKILSLSIQSLELKFYNHYTQKVNTCFDDLIWDFISPIVRAFNFLL
jgi:hypothetical protein